MSNDSTLPTTAGPPRTAQSAVLLNRLVLRAERDRDLAVLFTALYWTISPVGPWALSGTLYPYSPTPSEDHGRRLLDLAAGLFGGTAAEESERYDDKYAWHQLEFTYGGQLVKLRAAVHVESVEQQLRARIAELEAAAAAGPAASQ
ncbi:hypothetical protein [Streptomyces erythrochromogenes]|uniref:hypothetical protein n=1 Tax=Streptomyces erythrochromogenes TaxID=285574 RepID=UPI00343E415E